MGRSGIQKSFWEGILRNLFCIFVRLFRILCDPGGKHFGGKMRDGRFWKKIDEMTAMHLLGTIPDASMPKKDGRS